MPIEVKIFLGMFLVIAGVLMWGVYCMSRIDKKDCTEEKKSEPKRFYGLTMPSKILVVMDEYKDMFVLSCPQHGESKIIIPKENSRS